jgi:hypothetical protein
MTDPSQSPRPDAATAAGRPGPDDELGEHIERLEAMAAPDQQTWDLSPNDVEAIRGVLAEVERLRLVATEAADAARAAIVAAIGREVERMRRKVEPPPGGGCYLREDDDLGRLDAYEHALSLAESAGAGQATEGDARGD